MNIDLDISMNFRGMGDPMTEEERENFVANNNNLFVSG
jgi:hypothetical protein